jgi:hypothetical protein
MEQRTLRLGDIVDDYCPRERRVTNHAIVALVEDAIRQTRCTTCDAEHLYKGGREPRRKLVKKETSAMYDQVLANVVGAPAGAPPGAGSAESAGGAPRAAADPMAASSAGVPADGHATNGDAEPDGPEPSSDELWPAHRQLIRATLPRIEGEQPQPRPIPEFTMHQRQTRGAHAFRQGWHGGNGQPPGRGGGAFRPHRDPNANGNGNGSGNGNVPGGGRPGGGRRRHRRGKKAQ